MLEYESIFRKWVGYQPPLNALKDIQEVSHNVLLLHYLWGFSSIWVSRLALSATKPIELYLLKVFQLLLFCRFYQRIPWLTKFLDVCIANLFHLLLLLELEVFFSITNSSKIGILIWLDHWAHQSFGNIVLIKALLFLLIILALSCDFEKESHNLIFPANNLISLKFGIKILKSFSLFIKHKLVVLLRIPLSK